MEHKSYPKNDNLVPGSWKADEYGGLWTIFFKCSNGHIGTLGDHHIYADGKVSPSVVCPHDGCDFHEHIILEEWDPFYRKEIK